MATFTINFINNSNSSGSFCVFQQNRNGQNPGIFPLAWLAQPAYPQARVSISWNIEHYFFWAKTGELMPGVIFNAGEAIPTNLSNDNAITLTKRDNNYLFTDQRSGYQQGAVSVTADQNMAFHQASIGIGMSGSATAAIQAMPNMTYVFTPRPEYWVTFGQVQQGEVLNPDGLNDVASIEFPYGIFSMNATLNADNSWTITQGMD
jgi:rhizosphere induced protein